MVQPTNRRFVMEDRLDAEVDAIETALATKITNPAGTSNIADGAVTSAKIADGTIATGDIADGAVTSAKIADGTIATGDIADGAVTSAKIANGTIVEADLADGAVTSAKIADGTIVAGDLAANAVTTVKITDANVTTAKLADSAVTTAKLADANVTAAKLAANSVASANIIDGTIVTGDIADGAVTSAKIADGTIVAGDIADGAITSAKILDGTIVNADINASAAIAYTKITQQPITNLSDVQIASPTGGQVIKYDGSLTKWINGPAAGGVTASATAPTLSSAAAGDAWFDTNDGTLYVCYIDQDSTKQWVQVQANSALEGTILARLSSLEGQAIAYGTQSPNYLINGGFDINQRGSFASQTGSGYALDRWRISVGGTVTVSQQTSGVPIGTAACMRVAYNAASSFGNIAQPLESSQVAMLRGRTVTFSVRLRRNASFAANLNVSVEKNATADTATGGSWSAISTATVLNASLPTGTTASDWVVASVTAAVPNDGTANGLRVVVSESAAGASGAYWEAAGAQFEIGSTATAFRRNASSIQAELAACQRYFIRYGGQGPYNLSGVGYCESATVAWISYFVPSQMRTTPSVAIANNTSLQVLPYGCSVGGFLVDNNVNNILTPTVRVSVSSGLTAGGAAMLRAANNSTVTVDWSAEL